MTEWETINLLKKIQLALDEDGEEHPKWALIDIREYVREALDKCAVDCTNVVEVVTDGDFLIRFADGVEYSILEGVVPPTKVDEKLLTSDIMFVMDTTKEWKVVDWVVGISLMNTQQIVEYCKDLRKKGAE